MSPSGATLATRVPSRAKRPPVCVWARVPPEDPSEERYCAHVSDLVVLPQWRGRGIGRALLACGETYARERGAERLRIGVAPPNGPAGSGPCPPHAHECRACGLAFPV